MRVLATTVVPGTVICRMFRLVGDDQKGPCIIRLSYIVPLK